MGKICTINGQPYLVSLPRGGKSRKDYNTEWDDIITFLEEDWDNLFHWKQMYSWCQDSASLGLRDPSLHAIRGYNTSRFWLNSYDSALSVDTGFRPVLTPLNQDTMQPDSSILEDIPDGTRIALTSLYMDGKVVAEPQNPTDEGDIADYIPETEITLGNRDEHPCNWLHVIKYKNLLWGDRNILKNISWNELKKQGFAD